MAIFPIIFPLTFTWKNLEHRTKMKDITITLKPIIGTNRRMDKRKKCIYKVVLLLKNWFGQKTLPEIFKHTLLKLKLSKLDITIYKLPVTLCVIVRVCVYTGCSLIIVFFLKILKYSGLWSFSVFHLCQCVYTHRAGRKPALQQNWQS